MAEITALGAAIAAGIAKGIDAWNLKEISFKYNMYRPKISEEGNNLHTTRYIIHTLHKYAFVCTLFKVKLRIIFKQFFFYNMK